MDDNAVVAVAPKKMTKSGYPIEEALRPITLPRNMTEVGLDPHAMVSTFANSTSLRARYGITNKVQLGLTYAIGGIFDDPQTLEKSFEKSAGGFGLGSKKAKLWEAFIAHQQKLAQEAQEDFNKVFGRDFMAAYQSQLRKLKTGR